MVEKNGKRSQPLEYWLESAEPTLPLVVHVVKNAPPYFSRVNHDKSPSQQYHGEKNGVTPILLELLEPFSSVFEPKKLRPPSSSAMPRG